MPFDPPGMGIAGTTKMSLSCSRKIKFADSIIWVCLKIVYPYTQWLMIIIPTKWLFHWGNIPHFQTYPFEPGPDSLSCFTRIEMWQFQPFRWICTDPFQMSQLTLRSIVPQKRFMAIWEIWAPELPSGKRLHSYGKPEKGGTKASIPSTPIFHHTFHPETLQYISPIYFSPRDSSPRNSSCTYFSPKYFSRRDSSPRIFACTYISPI